MANAGRAICRRTWLLLAVTTALCRRETRNYGDRAPSLQLHLPRRYLDVGQLDCLAVEIVLRRQSQPAEGLELFPGRLHSFPIRGHVIPRFGQLRLRIEIHDVTIGRG